MVTISAVIPTKNRLADLQLAVASVLAQTRLPAELIIVDQSDDHEQRAAVEALCATRPEMRLVYEHARTVTGLVDAKRVGVARATGDIVSFLEDDVMLEPGYFEGVAWAFDSRSDILACCGVITNLPRTSPLYVLLQRLFLRGIFRDPRLSAFASAGRNPDALLPCAVLSGGTSSWRASVFDSVTFDTANGFHFFEDMEFATRVWRELGPHLYVNPRARLVHRGSAVNRDRNGRRQHRKMAEAIVFFRKRVDWPGAISGIVLGAVWWFGEATWQSLRLLSPGPVAGYLRGVIEGGRRPLVR